jgi:hypothetical protein
MSSPSSSSAAATVPAAGIPMTPAQLLEENLQMRKLGTQLEQQLKLQQEETRRLAAQLAATTPSVSTAVTASTSAAVAAASLGGRPKPPPLAQFSGAAGMGSQVDTWLRNVKKQIDWYGSSQFPDEKSKIRFATAHLESTALEWWDSIEDKDAIVTYEDFVQRLHDRYRPRLIADKARHGLAELRQTGTVSSLCHRMLTLLTYVPTMHEEDKIFIFKRALDKQIAAKVAEKEPASLHEAMEVAVLQEQYVGRSTNKAGSYVSNFHRGGFYRGASAASSSGSAPMEVNHVGWDPAVEADGNNASDEVATTDRGDPPVHQLLAMMQELKVQNHALASAFQKRAPSGGPRKFTGNKVPGISKEEYERCRKEGLCLKCKQSGHLARDCSKPVQRLKW